MADLPELDDQVQALGPIRPGDTLLIRVSPSVTQEEFQRLNELVGEYFRVHLPDVKLGFIAAEQVLVYRPSTD